MDIQRIMINAYSFGKMNINGTWYKHDLRINGETILPDWWRRSGHICDIEDIKVLLVDIPDILIIGQGTPGMMRVTQELKQSLLQRGITLIQQPTAKAVATFNDMYRQKNIAAGFHLTC